MYIQKSTRGPNEIMLLYKYVYDIHMQSIQVQATYNICNYIRHYTPPLSRRLICL